MNVLTIPNIGPYVSPDGLDLPNVDASYSDLLSVDGLTDFEDTWGINSVSQEYVGSTDIPSVTSPVLNRMTLVSPEIVFEGLAPIAVDDVDTPSLEFSALSSVAIPDVSALTDLVLPTLDLPDISGISMPVDIEDSSEAFVFEGKEYKPQFLDSLVAQLNAAA